VGNNLVVSPSAKRPGYAVFWSAVGALGATVALVAYLVVEEPSETTERVVHALLFVCVGAFALGALRVVVHVMARSDLSEQGKKVWLLWFWLGGPITVPLYLRRARL
jgi:hypothetical protein